MTITVREAVPDDADAVARLHAAAWQWAYAGSVPASYLAGLDAALPGRTRWWREGIAAPRPDTAHLVAEDDGTGGTGDAGLVGFVTVGPYRIDQDPNRLSPDEGEVRAIYVLPRRVRNGVGTMLLREGL